MPLHDCICNNPNCSQFNQEFEALHRHDEQVTCPSCNQIVSLLISPLADYTGQNSLTAQYVSRNAPKEMQDSHITKLRTDTSFLRKSIGTQKVGQ